MSIEQKRHALEELFGFTIEDWSEEQVVYEFYKMFE